MTAAERARLRALIDERRRELANTPREAKDASQFHGTPTGYRYACRCLPCRAAHARDVKAWMDRKKANEAAGSGVSDGRSGTSRRRDAIA